MITIVLSVLQSPTSLRISSLRPIYPRCKHIYIHPPTVTASALQSYTHPARQQAGLQCYNGSGVVRLLDSVVLGPASVIYASAGGDQTSCSVFELLAYCSVTALATHVTASELLLHVVDSQWRASIRSSTEIATLHDYNCTRCQAR